MAKHSETLMLTLTQGEDYSVGFEWQDRYGNPIEIADNKRARMQVRDVNGDLMLDFDSVHVQGEDPHIAVSSEAGFLLATCPGTKTITLAVGGYGFDVYAYTAAGSNEAFEEGSQGTVIATGVMNVRARITEIEEI